MVRLVREIHAADDQDEFEQRLLDGLARLLPADILSFNELEPRRARARFAAWPAGARERLDSRAFGALAGQNPLVEHYARTGDRRALRISDFISQRQLHERGVYRDVYRKLGVEYQLAVTLPAPRGKVIGVALNRSSADFADRERQLLDLLRPLIVSAHELVAERARLRAGLAAFEQLATSRSEALVVVDSRRRVAAASGGAYALVLRYAGGALRPDERLPAALDGWLGLALAGRTPPPQGVGLPLVMHAPGGRLFARLVPGGGAPGDVILLREIRDDRWAGVESRLLPASLSRREADVMRLVADGLTNQAIGARLGISARTVQRHLDHVYAKLGVHSRAGAVRLVLPDGGPLA